MSGRATRSQKRMLVWLSDQPDGAAKWFPIELNFKRVMPKLSALGFVERTPLPSGFGMETWRITDAGRVAIKDSLP